MKKHMDTLSESEYKEQYPVVGELRPESKAGMKRKTWQQRAAQLLEDETNNDEMVQTVDAIVDAAILSETPEPSSSATMTSTQALDTTTADGVSLMNPAESSPQSSAKEKTLAALSSSEMTGLETTKNDEMVQTVDTSIDAALLSETPEPSSRATMTSTQALDTTTADGVSLMNQAESSPPSSAKEKTLAALSSSEMIGLETTKNDEMVQTVDTGIDAALLSETPDTSSSATITSTQALDTTTADGVSLMNEAESSPPSSAKEKTLAALSSSEMIGLETTKNDEMVQTVDTSINAALLSETPDTSSSASMTSTQALDTTTADGVSLMNEAESSPQSSAKEKTLAALSSSEMIGLETTKNDEMVQTVDAIVDAAILPETPEPSSRATMTSTRQLNTTATDWVSEATGMNITDEHITEQFARYKEAGPQKSKFLALIDSEKNSDTD